MGELTEQNRKQELAISDAGITALLHGSGSFDVQAAFSKDIYLVHQMIVGMRYQSGADELVQDLKPGSRVTFLREPDNEYDHRAVMAVDGRGRKIGYIPRNQNAIISALLDAGKSFYGIVPTEEEESNSDAHKRDVPGALWVELYMREFTGPEDLQQIPRQGEQGSYAVVYIGLTETEPVKVREIFAIKVINGEERKSFHEYLADGADREEEKRLIMDFEEFAGFLPLVGYQFEGEQEKLLSEAYGVFLGKPFSNRIIEIGKMVQNHLPDLYGSSLDEINEELDLYSSDADRAERYCRMIWALYRRMDRSDLKRRMSMAAVRLTPLDELRKLHKISIHTCNCLRKEGFLLLGDVIDRSEKDLLKLPYIGSEQIEEIRGILDKEHVSLAEEDYEADHVTMSFPDNLRGLEEHAYAVLLSGLTEGEREELETLTGDEKADRISELIDHKLELCRRRGEASIYSSFLFLGALLGYRGDFSEAGYAMLKGDEEEQPDKTNGYLILSLFYDAMKKGTMRPEARQSMTSVCNALAYAILSGDLLDEVKDHEFHVKVAAILYRDAVDYARFARPTEDTVNSLMEIGWYFYEGEAELEDGTTVALEPDPELSFKAFHYAEQFGESYGREMKKRVLREYRK